ncbi:hypothetical protein FSARC_3948 [Fusarium sarcochroum]|uniref:Peptidase A1 domain-containing protein n=1 Tax=Fusarium sarcochroum TaxID=1208366 RepID=A0A8H4U2X6_9HYPO|nr:hypothetical protein FSARC_3948 [Fusarium sarcochroum]
MLFSNSFIAVAALSVTAEFVSGSTLPLRRRESKQSNPAPLIATEYASIFDVEVQFGNQSFMLLVDTGSSDTWVVETGFKCIDSSDNSIQPQSNCNYASTYDITSTFRPQHNQTFGVKYGTGIATGMVGFEDLTMGGITVTNQTVGIANSTDDIGDGVRSGLLGLAYPQLTSAHPGVNYPNDSLSLITNRAVYDTFLVSMYKSGLIEPWFSLALERPAGNTSSGHGGYLGLGELPPVDHSDEWTTVPVEISKSIPKAFYENSKPVLTWWTLTIDAVTWGPASGSSNFSSTLSTANTTTNSTAFQAVVDSGNPRNMFPDVVARKINAAFEPPAVYDKKRDVFVVDCDARAPALGVVIGGDTFWHDQRDLIMQAKDGVCTSGVGATQEALDITVHFLGDTFLKNVVSVFDFGVDKMRFAARVNNRDTTGSGNGAKPVPQSNAPSFSGVGNTIVLVALSVFAVVAL